MGSFQLHKAPARLIENSLKWGISKCGNIYMNEVAAYWNVDQLIFMHNCSFSGMAKHKCAIKRGNSHKQP